MARLPEVAMATVSVVIPSFNYGRFLPEAVASIRAQTFTDWECIIVDDGSTDGTHEIVDDLARLDARIRYVWKENGGLPAARNAGLVASHGEFVQFLDADDYIGTRKLARQLRSFQDRPDLDIVYGDVRYFAEGPTGLGGMQRDWVARPILRSASGAGDAVAAELIRDNIMVVQAALVRRAMLDRVGGFDPSLPCLEDWDCWLRCAEAGAHFFHDSSTDAEELSYVRLHPGSLSDDQLKMLKTALQIREGLDGRLRTKELRRLNDLRTHEQWAQVGVLEGVGEHPVAGFRWLLRASLAERRIKWLVWGLLIPAMRLPPGRRLLAAWRRRQSRRTSTEAVMTNTPT